MGAVCGKSMWVHRVGVGEGDRESMWVLSVNGWVKYVMSLV